VSPTQRNAEAVFKILSRQKRWTTGAFARDKIGGAVVPKHPDAVAWCAWGAVKKVAATEEEEDKLMEAIQRELCVVERLGVARINDGENGRKRILRALEKIRKGA
jgi:hypothetical protein